jgi:hypothetical protein
MKFNLNKTSGIDMIRRLCPDVKAEDLDGASEEELVVLASRLKKKAFGPGGSLGPSWTQVDNSLSDLVRAVPQFGGGTFDQQRKNLPGGTSNQTNKSQNSDEQTRGTPEDATPELKRLRMMERGRSSLSDPDGEYVVSFKLRPWDDENQIKKMLGEGAESDGVEVRVVVESFEKAVSKQNALPLAIVNRRRRVK